MSVTRPSTCGRRLRAGLHVYGQCDCPHRWWFHAQWCVLTIFLCVVWNIQGVDYKTCLEDEDSETEMGLLHLRVARLGGNKDAKAAKEETSAAPPPASSDETDNAEPGAKNAELETEDSSAQPSGSLSSRREPASAPKQALARPASAKAATTKKAPAAEKAPARPATARPATVQPRPVTGRGAFK